MARVIAYLRVSTGKQDLENQKLEIYNYSHKNSLIVDEFIEVAISSQKSSKQRKIDYLLDLLVESDTLIVSELSRLGRSVGQIIQIMDQLVKSKIHFIALKENIQISGEQDIQTKVMITMFSLFAEIERDLISERTKQGLAVAKAKGKQLGRPKGRGHSKLDIHRDEIKTLLENGSTKTFIAKKFNTSYSNLYSWLKYEKLHK